jgi:hypothetical protein
MAWPLYSRYPLNRRLDDMEESKFLTLQGLIINSVFGSVVGCCHDLNEMCFGIAFTWRSEQNHEPSSHKGQKIIISVPLKCQQQALLQFTQYYKLRGLYSASELD